MKRLTVTHSIHCLLIIRDFDKNQQRQPFKLQWEVNILKDLNQYFLHVNHFCSTHIGIGSWTFLICKSSEWEEVTKSNIKFRARVTRQKDSHLTDLVQVLRAVKSIDKCKKYKSTSWEFFLSICRSSINRSWKYASPLRSR